MGQILERIRIFETKRSKDISLYEKRRLRGQMRALFLSGLGK
jgi:hypothetical protein